MRSIGVFGGATLVVAAAVGGLGVGSARASTDPAVNGTFSATSNGEWARTNDSYHDEATVRSTWTITSSCADPLTCSGSVTSDQGWTANLTFGDGMWFVKRELPNWETCFDGTAATGHQIFRFYPVDPATGFMTVGSTTLAGEDATTGVSGACGKNWLLTVRMPFKLVKID
ncbi:MAG: hypothetical protein JO280_17730 [Mycobacteriaceae bacterium]|nr:hypothetical protein [Mycobacteriaceae bacterium]